MSLTPEVAAALDSERVKLGAAEAPASASASDRVAIRRAISLAFVAAFRQMAFVAAGLALVGALAAAVMIHR